MDKGLDLMEDTIYGAMAPIGKIGATMITKTIEATFGSPSIDGIAETIVYYSLFSEICVYLHNYYFMHRNDSGEHIGADLRAVGIMYLNTVQAAVTQCRFDPDMEETADRMDAVLLEDMKALMAYGDQDYEPGYTNDRLPMYLDDLLSAAASDRRKKLFCLLTGHLHRLHLFPL